MKDLNAGGFTLIELLIVVAIIAILAAIAVPNFLEAQTRSKVSRAKADMRSLATALEAYCIDYNNYPDTWRALPLVSNDGMISYVEYLWELTTPVAYTTSTSIRDPFAPDRDKAKWVSGFQLLPGWLGSYHYWCYSGLRGYPDFHPRAFVISSWGPDRMNDYMERHPYYRTMNVSPAADLSWLQPPAQPAPPHWMDQCYDPTNGTRSRGDIGRTAGFANVPTTIP